MSLKDERTQIRLGAAAGGERELKLVRCLLVKFPGQGRQRHRDIDRLILLGQLLLFEVRLCLRQAFRFGDFGGGGSSLGPSRAFLRREGSDGKMGRAASTAGGGAPAVVARYQRGN